jgi:hypothetical protein
VPLTSWTANKLHPYYVSFYGVASYFAMTVRLKIRQIRAFYNILQAASLISRRNRLHADRMDNRVATFHSLTIKSFTGTFASYEEGRLLLRLKKISN